MRRAVPLCPYRAQRESRKIVIVCISEGVLQDWLRNVRALWVSKRDSESRTEMQIARGENACPIVLQSMVDRTTDLCSQQAIGDVKRAPDSQSMGRARMNEEGSYSALRDRKASSSGGGLKITG